MDRDLLRDGVAYADQWLAHQRAQREIPGLVAAIQVDDERVLSKAYGLANLEDQTPMTTSHIFRIASHSKTFTATAIMRLVEAGKLRLDDRAAAHLYWLSSDVTVRQLLNHVSGTIRDGEDATFWDLERPFPDLAGLKALVRDIAAPNTHFKYSNVGYSLLGLVIEAASGQPYNQYVKAEIVDRLGLRDTGPETHPGIADRLAGAYTARRPPLPRQRIDDIPTNAMSSATGFYSTAEDLCRYARGHYLGNVELLSDASKREMQHPSWSIDQAESQYGLGLAVQKIGKRQMVGHGGGFPGVSTNTLIDPVDRLVVVVLNNTHGPGGLAAPLATTVVKLLDFAPAPHVVALERYVGRFCSLWTVIDVVAFGDRLVALHPDEDDPTSEVTELEVVDEDTLRIGATAGYGSRGELVRYERNAAGAIECVWIAGHRHWPQHVFADRIRTRV